MDAAITRKEVLLEFGNLIAELRDRREQKRESGKPLVEKEDRRIECLQIGYEFISMNWRP